jgi:hypothetical protein
MRIFPRRTKDKGKTFLKAISRDRGGTEGEVDYKILLLQAQPFILSTRQPNSMTNNTN